MLRAIHIIILLLLQLLWAADLAHATAQDLKNTQALANTFFGSTSAGETIIGYSWFIRGASHGRFCARIDADATCAGIYPARTRDLNISVSIRCSDGRRGVVTVQRRLVREQRLIVAETAKIVFKDGTAAHLRFGETVPHTTKKCDPAEAGS